MNSFLKHIEGHLNKPQMDAVEHLEGPLLILAGAGSGKTRVLTYRIANLIASGTATADQIWAVTFTNKAAKNMQERTNKLLWDLGLTSRTAPWISTFHSSCARILRDHGELLGYEKNFVIYDDSDQMSMIKKVAETLGFNDKIYPPRSFQARINEAKQLGQTPRELATKALNFLDEKNLKVYELYEREMKKANAMDFGDLLFRTYQLFAGHADVLEYYQNRFKFISVDEYQDTNNIQYKMLNLVAQKYENICVVGDEDQSIYSWRGADITNILNFESDYPTAKVIKLEQNYRSTQNIVLAASEVIKNNTQRKNKNLFSKNDEGELIQLQEEYSEHKEAQFVCREIQSIVQQSDVAYKDFAVFYRTNAQSRVFEDQLRQHSIPYRIVGAVNFYDRAEVKDLVSYLKILVNPRDDISVKRIINRPARRIGKATIDRLEQLSVHNNVTMLEMARTIVSGGLESQEFHSGALKGLANFLNILEKINEASIGQSPSDIYERVLEISGYAQSLQAENTVESQARIDNLDELKSALKQFELERGEEASVPAFLEEMALITDLDRKDENIDSIVLMTLHLSKGLEYPYVFLVGLEDGLFPSRQSFDSLDPTALEEERRLCYVGMTRAEKKLYITYARQRYLRGMEEHFPPSRFLKEIPEKYLARRTSIPSPRFMSGISTSGTSQRTPQYSPFPSDDNEFDQAYEDANDFRNGMRVRHPIFGIGVIHQCEGEGESQRVTVLFSNNTLKKFAIKFARLDRI